MSGRRGFTLIEVLAVVLLTSLVIGVALNHYVNLSRATERAAGHSEGARRAVALLDRVARDYESALLVATPTGVDPLTQPWIFSGEQRYSALGADQLKFITLAHHARSSVAHESDLATVVYCLRQAEDGESFRLLRWSSPRLPEPGSDVQRMPCEEGDGARLLADGLADFGVTFLDGADDGTSSWDSTQVADANALPEAVQIQVAFVGDLPDADALDDAPRVYSRSVPIRVQALDMEELDDPTALVNGGTGEGSDEEDDEDSGSCSRTPCAGRPACAVIGCEGKLGQFGGSIDTILRNAQTQQTGFCDWRDQVGPQVRRLLIDDPDCR
jgi:prepilin-type N-terminal cleavage/methylation domain-containing protein